MHQIWFWNLNTLTSWQNCPNLHIKRQRKQQRKPFVMIPKTQSLERPPADFGYLSVNLHWRAAILDHLIYTIHVHLY